MPKKFREFEGYHINGGKFVSQCEVCGIERQFVHVTRPEQHIYCKDCDKLLRKLQQQEKALAENLPDIEQDEEVEE